MSEIGSWLETDGVESYLKEHPRLLGMLFGLAVLLAQTAPVLASGDYIAGR